MKRRKIRLEVVVRRGCCEERLMKRGEIRLKVVVRRGR